MKAFISAASKLGSNPAPSSMTIPGITMWLPGPDPDGLRLEAEGCYMQGKPWNAQIDGERPEDADAQAPQSSPRPLAPLAANSTARPSSQVSGTYKAVGAGRPAPLTTDTR